LLPPPPLLLLLLLLFLDPEVVAILPFAKHTICNNARGKFPILLLYAVVVVCEQDLSP
jgi:hypothetical protein